MSLLANLNAFKNKVKTAPVLTTKTAKSTSPAASTKSTTPTPSISKRPFVDDDNDDDTISSTHEKELKKAAYDSGSGSGTHLSTKLLLAVGYIKEKGRPVTVESLLSYLNLNGEEQRTKLVNLLVKLDKIEYNERDKTVEYVSIYNIKSKDQLLSFLRGQATFKGISVKELKDGWSGCLDAIDELEKEGKILVLRMKKNDDPRLVWANVGSELGLVDDEFMKTWNDVKLPERAELPGMLKSLGLKPASVDPATGKEETTQEIKREKAERERLQILIWLY
ncbi:Transcription initiation factor IIE subunit beta [Cyberlindnera fabianii]|uniref:Transcription initiation factor IIE subunit beta n=1 Tax=Cyberlindnera fabianii TaxID=36022 RepID=A0A1V2LC25_CYBFA|nr:Transcription initiation factor IIE subunit beta [Cyberlindnera fabianii]